jgi:hypothetical protein
MSVSDVAAFWRSLCIVNDNAWARLLDAPAGIGAAESLRRQKMETVAALEKAPLDRVQKALPAITAEEYEQVREAARAWLAPAPAVEAVAAVEQPQDTQGVSDGGSGAGGTGAGDIGGDGARAVAGRITGAR